jgi:CheY-like chemotaxis protein
VSARASILVIEDDEDIRGLLSLRLERMGYQVRSVASGEDGVEAAIKEPPHLVMLDILLPGIDGWEVARRLRANPATAAVPLVIASIVEPTRDLGNLGDQEEDPSAPGGRLPVEANAFLAKPFTARQVETVIARIVGSPPGAGSSPEPSAGSSSAPSTAGTDTEGSR